MNTVEKPSLEASKQYATSKRRIWKNIIVISLVFLLNFLSYGGLSKLQSSLHDDAGMGTICQSLTYVAMIIACLFFPRAIIRVLGHKWTMAVSLISYILWDAANAFPTWATMATTSILVGIFAAPLWTAQCSYFTEIAKTYASATNKSDETVVNLFFGVFFLFFQVSNLLGNIISSTILQQTPTGNQSVIDPDDIADTCGMNDCPNDDQGDADLDEPDANTVKVLCIVYVVIAISSFFLCAFLVDDLPPNLRHKSDKSLGADIKESLFATIVHLKDKRLTLLIPLSIYTGLEQGFMWADWTNSWITCALGIWMIGFISIPFCITDAATSLISGKLTPLTGRVPIFTAALVIDIGIQLTLALWSVHPEDLGLFYGIPCLWGISDGIWQTQSNALFGVLFSSTSEAAFANFKMWQALGFAMSFSYSAALCTNIKLFIMFFTLIVSYVCYLIVEWIEKKQGSVIEIVSDQKTKIKDISKELYTIT